MLDTAVILSLRPSWAELVVSGAKTVELRRSRPRRPFDTAYLYVSSPVQAIVAKCRVTRAIAAPPIQLLARFGRDACISARDGAAYFHGASIGVALLLAEVVPTQIPLTLANLRRAGSTFHPPQSFSYVPEALQDILNLAFLEHPYRP